MEQTHDAPVQPAEPETQPQPPPPAPTPAPQPVPTPEPSLTEPPPTIPERRHPEIIARE